LLSSSSSIINNFNNFNFTLDSSFFSADMCPSCDPETATNGNSNGQANGNANTNGHANGNGAANGAVSAADGRDLQDNPIYESSLTQLQLTRAIPASKPSRILTFTGRTHTSPSATS
jgi:hypothetical protein